MERMFPWPRRRCGLLAPLLLGLYLLWLLLPAGGVFAGERSFVLALVGGEPEGGPPTFQVTQGDEVRLTVTSDVPGELHLHGYDLTLDLVPGAGVELRFPARHSGRYPAALHGQGSGGGHGGSHGGGALFYLEVYPQ